MATTKDSAPAHPSTRELRGIALYRDHAGEIEHTAPHVYVVPGCKGGTYAVHLKRETCTCPDHERHPELVCKHRYAATIKAAKSRARVAS